MAVSSCPCSETALYLRIHMFSTRTVLIGMSTKTVYPNVPHLQARPPDRRGSSASHRAEGRGTCGIGCYRLGLLRIALGLGVASHLGVRPVSRVRVRRVARVDRGHNSRLSCLWYLYFSLTLKQIKLYLIAITVSIFSVSEIT